MVRKDKDELDTKLMNPHKVQLFSLNEIWKNILSRLVELNVIKDPDDFDEDSGESSEELEDEFDFVKYGQLRVGRLLKNKRLKSQKEKALVDIMPQNDFNVINKMLQKAIEHELHVKKCSEYDIFNFVSQTREIFKQQQNQLDTFENLVKTMNKKMIKEVVTEVNKLNGGPVTEAKVLAFLEVERSTNIKHDILSQFSKVNELLKPMIEEAQLIISKNYQEQCDMLKIVQKHDAYIEDNEKEYILNPDEELKYGIKSQYGVKFDI